MNLHAIAAPIVGVVNPPIVGSLQRSTGYTTAATGKREPTYATAETVTAQVQALSGPELALVDGLNIQGIKRAMHLPGDVKGVDRASGLGGDLITFTAGPGIPASIVGTWLVAMVMETWDTPGWCRVAVVKQNGG